MQRNKDSLNEDFFKDGLNIDNNAVPKFDKEKIDIDDYLKENNNFFVSASNIYPSVMRVMNWIMRHTYLIVVIYIGILFIVKFLNP